MEKDAGEVERMAVLPDEVDNDPTSWSCLLFLSGCHVQNPMAGGERCGQRRLARFCCLGGIEQWRWWEVEADGKVEVEVHGFAIKKGHGRGRLAGRPAGPPIRVH